MRLTVPKRKHFHVYCTRYCGCGCGSGAMFILRCQYEGSCRHSAVVTVAHNAGLDTSIVGLWKCCSSSELDAVCWSPSQRSIAV